MSLNNFFSIDSDTYKGIIKIVYQDEHEFNINDAKEVLKEIEQIAKDKSFPILKIPGKYSSIDNEARKFISSPEGMKYSSAEAFVTTFLPHRIIGNFYMKINKPVKPTAFFETEKQAVEWLKQYVSKE